MKDKGPVKKGNALDIKIVLTNKLGLVIKPNKKEGIIKIRVESAYLISCSERLACVSLKFNSCNSI